MNISFAEKIKNLRKEKNISQERLAQYLGVSFQAVSKWENSNTYPDIELLPHIARFFGITVDELLQAEQIDEKELYKEYKEKACEFYRNGQIARVLPIWQEAYRKMPNNTEVKEMLMSTYFDIDKIKYQKEIVELGTEIYHSDCGTYYKGQAIEQIARTYAANGNREMAKKWALKAFPLMHSREMLFMQITDDTEELLSEFSFANYWFFKNLFYMCTRISGCENIQFGTEYIKNLNRALASIYELVFPDDDMGFEDLKCMCVIYRSIAEDEAVSSKNEELIEHYLIRALECAEKSVSVKEHILEHPLVMGWRVYDAPSDNKQIVRLLKKELSFAFFDKYRDMSWFKNITERIDKSL